MFRLGALLHVPPGGGGAVDKAGVCFASILFTVPSSCQQKHSGTGPAPTRVFEVSTSGQDKQQHTHKHTHPLLHTHMSDISVSTVRTKYRV